MSTSLKVILIDGKFPNYYDLLKVARDASERDVILAYRKIALDEHPDKAGGGQKQNETFSHINNARDVLTDGVKRRQYNAQLLKHEAAVQRPTRQDANAQSYSKPPESRRSKTYTPWQARNLTTQKPYYCDPFYNSTRSHIAFDRFSPPVSGHPLDSARGRFGTKPAPDCPWAQSIYRGTTVGRMHEAACQYADLICDSARRIQAMVVNIEKVAALYLNNLSFNAHAKTGRRLLGSGIELFVELVHFVAESYHYHKHQLDMTIYMPVALAAPLIQEHGFLLEKLSVIITSTWNHLCKVNDTASGRYLSIFTVFDELVTLFGEWNTFCELPSNLLNGIDDTFYTTDDHWKNNWVRRRAGGIMFGYQSKRFVLRGGQQPGTQRSNPQASGQWQPPSHQDWFQQSKQDSTQAPPQQPDHQPKQPSQGHFGQQQGSQSKSSNTAGFSGFVWGSDNWRKTMPQSSKKDGSKKDDRSDDSDLIE